jgi:hypothetical protein
MGEPVRITGSQTVLRVHISKGANAEAHEEGQRVTDKKANKIERETRREIRKSMLERLKELYSIGLQEKGVKRK